MLQENQEVWKYELRHCCVSANLFVRIVHEMISLEIVAYVGHTSEVQWVEFVWEN